MRQRRASRKGIIVCACVIVLLAGFGCKSEGEEALTEGNTLLKSKDPADWDKAIESFKKSIDTEVRARNRMIEARKKIGRRNIDDADRLTVGREDEMERLLVGGISRHIGMQEMEFELYTSAISNLEIAAQSLPNDKNSYYLLGLAYGQISRSKLDKAESDILLNKADANYRIALKIDPAYAVALYGHSIVLILLKNYPEAEQTCRQLIQIEPKESRGYFALARIYYETEEYIKAENIYRMLLEILPSKSAKRATVEENLRKLQAAPRTKR